jgi:hypothetical protein
MSVNSFKFVSPGVFINEIDQSELPREAEEIGPVVVGRALKGPIMRPVKVQSFLEFEQLFGLPIAGNANVDVWREGNKLAPTYGAFAAEAYLRNAGPLTFVRLGGFQNEDAETAGKAGWATEKSLNASLADNGGAYGLFVAPTTGAGASTTVNATGTLAAVIYVDKGTVGLSGSDLAGNSINRAGVWVRSSEGASKEFKLYFNDDTGNSEEKVVNFDEDSKLFIRNVLNTNPTKTNQNVTTTSGLQIYWLGQTFETTIVDGSGNYAGVLIPLASGTLGKGGEFKKGAEKASTGWIFAQHKGATGSFAADASGEYPVQNLFKFHTLSEDEWTQSNVKVSIQDISLPPNKFTKFGTFSVVVRSMQDTDDQPVILERFDLCTIDPSSPNYVAKKIGDKETTWDYTNRRYIELGSNDNKSRYVRIEMDPDVEAGAVDSDLLPFGFYGPKKFKSVAVTGSAGIAQSVSGTNSFLATNGFVGVGGLSSSVGIVGANHFTASLKFPTVPTVDTSTTYYVTRPTSVYWGVKTTVGSTKQFNKEIPEYLRTLPSGVGSSANVLQYSFVFSLDDVSGTLAAGSTTRYTAASWAEGKRASGASLSSLVTGSGTLDKVLNVANKFTLPLVGGFEGLDITEKEPFNNRGSGPLDTSKTELTSYAINSINVAIDSISDAEVVEMNSLVVPGVTNVNIHTKMISTCEARGDSLAIVDLVGDYTPATENTETEAQRKPNVQEAVSYVKDTLTLNSSYGCTFFPWVKVKDRNSANTVWMPPSVVALGTFGSTKRFSEVWFAPAGFTRGGLSEAQAGGLAVVDVAQKLNTKERDKLYEANINPIASFPAEGVVIFGQKTLQTTRSALDRINVRRLMNYVKKEISRIASTILFDPNTQVTWDRFTGQVEPFLASVQSRLGLEEFRVILDETTTTPELVDRNILYAKIFLKPTRAIEFIALDFTITNSGASFND